jgi:polysaccharide deacetylase family protein (PEP-CTERM system associated)
MITNVLSVDVEEYYHAAIFRRGTSAMPARGYESRVERSLDRLLGLMRDHHAKGTFFVLGEVARLHPASVRRIVEEGHEIASHGDGHEDVYGQSAREFRADIRRSKARIEDVAGERVVGYRAPNFSIGRAQAWAYQVLLEEGYTYDSSTYPIFHDRYGQASAPRFPYEIWRDGPANLMEFPIGTARLLGVNLPIGGGGYFRLSPFELVRMGIQRVNAQDEQPVMFYLHPWELDPDQPRPAMAWHHRFRHYVGVKKHAAKIDHLLAHFRFGTARQILEAGVQPAALAQVEPTALPVEQQSLSV